jgi:UDP-glucuronate 4-epimerase
MALFLFTKAIIEGKPIDVYNNGNMQRDFTYIDDIVEGVLRVIDKIPQADSTWSGSAPNPSGSVAPYKIFNIGNSSPVKLMEFIEAIETSIGMKAEKNFMPLQAGDVPSTWADVEDLWTQLGFKPKTSVIDGIARFIEWYKEYFKIV